MGLINTDEAIKLLKSGTPVALPTETVYGLACPIDQPEALKKVFEIKKRPLNDPLIVHVSDVDMARTLFKNPSEDFEKLASAFWPGPLTLISKKNKTLVSDLITSNLDSVAVRIPASELFQEVIRKTGAPLAAPSANMFKKVSPTTAEHVLQTLPSVDVLDGGACGVGIESTILDIDNLTVLRPGIITAEDIQEVVLKPVSYKDQTHVPGSETDHYQPSTPVHVFNSKETLKEFLSTHDAVELSLKPVAIEASKEFYTLLRTLDKKAKYICVYFNPAWNSERWAGLKNRLLKSSSQWSK